MTGLLLENTKLILLFALVAAVIVLSHLGQASPVQHKPRRRTTATAAL